MNQRPPVLRGALLPTTLAVFSAVSPTRGLAQEGGAATSRPAESQPERPTFSRDEALAAARRAWSKMLTLQGIEFETAESQNDSMTRQLGRILGAGATEVDGRWTPNSLAAFVGSDDEVVLHAGRMIARDDDFDWVLRRDRLAGGRELPFLFDPGRFFEVVGGLDPADLQITRHVVEKTLDRLVLVVSFSAVDSAADELILTGGLPAVAGIGGVMMIGGLADMPRPDVEIDFSIAIDPVSHLVHSIHAKAYQESGMGGMVTIQGAVLNEAEEEAEPMRTTDEHGNRIYKNGLPLREVEDDESFMTFEVRLSNHDKPMRPQLDDAGRKLLRMR